MYEWNEVVQAMIDWIEEHITESPGLLEMSKQIGYSPCYCSSQFHTITGMTLKSYVAKRRLCRAALEVRDTDERILEIALKYGFSSQQALTRAFVHAYGCTPGLYRKNPEPVPFSMKKEVLFPEYYQNKGEPTMNKTVLTDANVRVEFIPDHKYMAVRDNKVTGYFPFWEYHNCDKVCGMIESMEHVAHPLLGCHTAGWFWENGKKGYSYGMGLLEDYQGKIPDGFETYEYPGSYYLVFYHPVFDFLKDCEEVMKRVEDLAWNFDPAVMGFQWNEGICQDYQRQMPEKFGYEVLRPVKRMI